ncbi:MAG: hypothetical protein ACXADY_15000 [Candidatus Hodarchaeales archaeon]|jgi:hypothetical protein
MKTPTLIGTLIFVISLLIAFISALPPGGEVPYAELFLIWIGGVVGGIGLGYGNRDSFGFDEGNGATVVGGLGLGLSIVVTFLFYFYEHPADSNRVIMTFIGSLVAILGLYMVVVSSQESY